MRNKRQEAVLKDAIISNESSRAMRSLACMYPLQSELCKISPRSPLLECSCHYCSAICRARHRLACVQVFSAPGLRRRHGRQTGEPADSGTAVPNRSRGAQNLSCGHDRISRTSARIAPHPTAMMSQNRGRDQAVHRTRGLIRAIRPQTVMARSRITLKTSAVTERRSYALSGKASMGAHRREAPLRLDSGRKRPGGSQPGSGASSRPASARRFEMAKSVRRA
jgi:hypothetical protein